MVDNGRKQDLERLLSRHSDRLANGGHRGMTHSKPLEWIEVGTGAVLVEKLALYGWLQKHKAAKGDVTRYKITNPRSSIQQ